MLSAVHAAVKLEKFDFLKKAFGKEYAAIREGAVGLSEAWFEYQARKLARKRGIAFSPEQIDRALPLPTNLDFRMFG